MNLRKGCFAFVLLSTCISVAAAQSDDEFEIFQLVNQQRIRSRLAPLAWDENLGRVARSYSKKMAHEGFFGHYDRSGKTVSDRSREARVGYWQKIGENLFMVTDNPNYVEMSVQGWMRSPSHRKNIRDRSWNATGIGIARSRDGQIYITQVFIGR